MSFLTKRLSTCFASKGLFSSMCSMIENYWIFFYSYDKLGTCICAIYLKWTFILLLFRNPRLQMVQRCTGFSFPKSPFRSLVWNPCDRLEAEVCIDVVDATVEAWFFLGFLGLFNLFVVLEDVIEWEKFPVNEKLKKNRQIKNCNKAPFKLF